MSEQATIPTSFIAVLQRYIEQRQLIVPELSKRLAHFQAQPKMANCEYDQLLHELQAIDPIPAFGVILGQIVQPKDFGIVGYLLTACSTLGQALTRYGHFQTLVLSELSTQVDVSSGVIRHRWHLHDVDTQLSAEFGVSMFINLYQSLIGKKIAPIKVGLPFKPPENPQLYESLFGCPVEFNAECLMADVPANVMWMTITSSDPYMRKIFDGQAEAMLKAEVEKSSDTFGVFFENLQQQILMAMKDGDTSAKTVAKQMGYSTRSFYRILEEAGYSYRSVISGLRRRLAKKYLSDESLSYSDIAMLLGYSEQSAFTRAFKDWMGMTPGEYRKNIKSQ
ncbi:AraC family transcriptional regulator [Oceaniserpentilla sp. 4NH20-0058]|uniref:AraC family transcriptional regulator n=1 Tax=Oceaniserpentilla sp. 4NH20-0058 TaxID=3127660 RepID=UPI00310AE98D